MVAACGFLFYKSIICSYLQSSHFSFLWFIPISVVFFYPKRRIIKILILCKVILYIATNVSKNSDVTPVKISRTCEFSDRCQSVFRIDEGINGNDDDDDDKYDKGMWFFFFSVTTV